MCDDTDSLGEDIDCLRQGKPELLDFDSAVAIATHLDLLDNKIFNLLQAQKADEARIAAIKAALEPFAEKPDDRMNDYPCHRGIYNDPRDCTRCGNAIRAWEALQKK